MLLVATETEDAGICSCPVTAVVEMLCPLCQHCFPCSRSESLSYYFFFLFFYCFMSDSYSILFTVCLCDESLLVCLSVFYSFLVLFAKASITVIA